MRFEVIWCDGYIRQVLESKLTGLRQQSNQVDAEVFVNRAGTKRLMSGAYQTPQNGTLVREYLSRSNWLKYGHRAAEQARQRRKVSFRTEQKINERNELIRLSEGLFDLTALDSSGAFREGAASVLRRRR